MASAAPAASPLESLPELTQGQKLLTLLGTLLALFLAALDQTVVATAGPAIQKSLGIEPGLYIWITTAYGVASTVMVPLWGKLSDLYGRKRIILSGVALFLAASALCGLAQSTGQLIAFRALQGMGSASLFTSAFAVVADLFPPAQRGKYSGVFGAAFAVSSLVGPLLGGAITDAFGWHWVFFINLPIGAVAFAFIWLKMPPLRRAHATPPKVDFVGALLLAIGVVPLLVAFSLARLTVRPGATELAWGSWQLTALFAVALLGVVGFVLWERLAPEPLVELSLFKEKTFALGNAAYFLMGSVFLTPMVFLPLYMVNVVGVSATASGLTLVPLSLAVVFGNVAAGQLASRLGSYKSLMLGTLALLVAGLAIFSFTLRTDSTQAEVTVKMILVGLGLGPAIPLYSLAIQNAAPINRIGVATAASTFFRQLGSSLGIALAGTLFASTLAARLAEEGASLPAAVQEQLAAAGSAERGRSSFNLTQSKAALHQQFEQQRNTLRLALEGNGAAIADAKRDPATDRRLRLALEAGGVKALVEKSFEGNFARVRAAAQEPGAWAALQQDSALPPSLRAATAAVDPAALADPVARVEALNRLRADLQPALAASVAQALGASREVAEQAVRREEERTMAALEGAGASVKAAFTDAIKAVYRMALALCLAMAVLTVLLPKVALRKTQRGAAPG